MTATLYAGVKRSAEISKCGRYRWWLRRQWIPDNGRVVCFVMLNPSTADASIDDPTIRRCMRYARDWGYSTLSVRNLFALRATDPGELKTAANPTGGLEGDHNLFAARTADLVVAAWGAWVPFGRDHEVMSMLAGVPVHCLGTTKGGGPRHPLYCRADLEPVLWRHDRVENVTSHTATASACTP